MTARRIIRVLVYVGILVAIWMVLDGPIADAADPDRCERRPHLCTTTTTSSPTTTIPSDTTTVTPIEDPPVRFGVTGCSNTNHAVAGYLAESEVDLLVNTAWAGRTVELWANSDQPWEKYYLPQRPPGGFAGVWINLCERVDPGLTVENVEAIIARVWAIDPGIPVYLSPLNFYVGEDCAVTGGNIIPDEGAVIADALAGADPDDLILRGPDLGPLGVEHLRRDACHPNAAGIGLLGSQLVGFFDEVVG